MRRGDNVRVVGTLVAESRQYFYIGKLEELQRISEKELYPLKENKKPGSVRPEQARGTEIKEKENTIMSFMIETSARHIHLTQETVEKLFGEGYQLTIRKPLSYQPVRLQRAPDHRRPQEGDGQRVHPRPHP